jgi:hypothetical protein
MIKQIERLRSFLQREEKKILIDLEDLRSEYESTYLSYFKQNPMSFEKWLKKEKGIVIIKKKPK